MDKDRPIHTAIEELFPLLLLCLLGVTFSFVWDGRGAVVPEKGPLDITYKNRTYYLASSPYQEDLHGLGGFGGSGNEYEHIEHPGLFPHDSLSLVIDPDKVRAFAGGYEGMLLYLANRTGDTLYFPAQDSRLDLKLQARDKDGKWRDIQYVPKSKCGNSYHTLYLPPLKFWSFTVPRYTGDIKTEVRAVLVYQEERAGPMEGEEVTEKRLCSNTVKMSINPGQFRRKGGYQRKGLMDPYDE